MKLFPEFTKEETSKMAENNNNDRKWYTKVEIKNKKKN